MNFDNIGVVKRSQTVYKIGDKYFQRLDTVGDGRCLFASFFGSLSGSPFTPMRVLTNLNPSERTRLRDYITKLYNCIIKLMVEGVPVTDHVIGNIKSINEEGYNGKTYNWETFGTDTYGFYLSRCFERNIIIINEGGIISEDVEYKYNAAKSREAPVTVIVPDHHITYKDTVYIWYSGNNHFEMMREIDQQTAEYIVGLERITPSSNTRGAVLQPSVSNNLSMDVVDPNEKQVQSPNSQRETPFSILYNNLVGDPRFCETLMVFLLLKYYDSKVHDEIYKTVSEDKLQKQMINVIQKYCGNNSNLINKFKENISKGKTQQSAKRITLRVIPDLLAKFGLCPLEINYDMEPNGSKFVGSNVKPENMDRSSNEIESLDKLLVTLNKSHLDNFAFSFDSVTGEYERYLIEMINSLIEADKTINFIDSFGKQGDSATCTHENLMSKVKNRLAKDTNTQKLFVKKQKQNNTGKFEQKTIHGVTGFPYIDGNNSGDVVSTIIGFANEENIEEVLQKCRVNGLEIPPINNDLSDPKIIYRKINFGGKKTITLLYTGDNTTKSSVDAQVKALDSGYGEDNRERSFIRIDSSNIIRIDSSNKIIIYLEGSNSGSCYIFIAEGFQENELLLQLAINNEKTDGDYGFLLSYFFDDLEYTDGKTDLRMSEFFKILVSMDEFSTFINWTFGVVNQLNIQVYPGGAISCRIYVNPQDTGMSFEQLLEIFRANRGKILTKYIPNKTDELKQNLRRSKDNLLQLLSDYVQELDTITQPQNNNMDDGDGTEDSNWSLSSVNSSSISKIDQIVNNIKDGYDKIYTDCSRFMDYIFTALDEKQSKDSINTIINENMKIFIDVVKNGVEQVSEKLKFIINHIVSTFGVNEYTKKIKNTLCELLILLLTLELIQEYIFQNGNNGLDVHDFNTLKSFLLVITKKENKNDFSYETQTTNGRTRRFLNSTGESIVTSVGVRINAELPQINAALLPEVVNILQNVRKAYVTKAVSSAEDQLKRGENVNQKIDNIPKFHNDSDAKKYLEFLNILFKSEENFLKCISNEESIISEYKRVIQILNNELVPLLNENNDLKRLSSLINIFYYSIGGYSLYESTLIGQLLFQLMLTDGSLRRFRKDDAEKMWSVMNKENEQYLKKHNICNVEESIEEVSPAKVEFLKAIKASWRDEREYIVKLLINLIENGSPTPQLDTIDVFSDILYIPEEEEFEEDYEEISPFHSPTGSPSRYASQPTPGTTASDRNFISYDTLSTILQGRFSKLKDCFLQLEETYTPQKNGPVVQNSQFSDLTWIVDVPSREGSPNNSRTSTPYPWKNVPSRQVSQNNSGINMDFLDDVDDENSDDAESPEKKLKTDKSDKKGGSRKHRKKYTRKPKFTRRKNKKSPKRKTIKKRKMPKRKNKTRRQRK